MSERMDRPLPCLMCKAETEHWWSYCAMCGYHIAGGAPLPASFIGPVGRHFHCPKCSRVMHDGDCAEDNCPYAADPT